MANILKTIIENDKGELRKLEKMADKVLAYEDENGSFCLMKNFRQKRKNSRNAMLMAKL